MRCLNRDLLGLLTGSEDGRTGAEALFDWLKGRPFLEDTSEGWAYHDIVRTQMLRYKRRESPESWTALQAKLADYFDQQRQSLGLETEKQQTDPTWQSHTLNLLYHRLCQAPQTHLPTALNEFLLIWKTSRKFAREWAEVLAKAGKDTEFEQLKRWGEQLTQGSAAYEDSSYEATLQMFSALLKEISLDEKAKIIAIAWRGMTYGLMKQYERALQDLDRALELDSNDSWAIASQGEIYRVMKRYEEALQDFDRAIELDSNDSWAIARRGKIYCLMRRLQEALSNLNRAIEFDSENDWNLYSRALVYQALSQFDLAKADLERAIQLARQDYEKDPQNYRNTFNLAIYYLATADRENAKLFYRDALNRGATALSIREAIEDLEDFLVILPQHSLADLARQAKALLERRLSEQGKTEGEQD